MCRAEHRPPCPAHVRSPLTRPSPNQSLNHPRRLLPSDPQSQTRRHGTERRETRAKTTARSGGCAAEKPPRATRIRRFAPAIAAAKGSGERPAAALSGHKGRRGPWGGDTERKRQKLRHPPAAAPRREEPLWQIKRITDVFSQPGGQNNPAEQTPPRPQLGKLLQGPPLPPSALTSALSKTPHQTRASDPRLCHPGSPYSTDDYKCFAYIIPRHAYTFLGAQETPSSRGRQVLHSGGARCVCHLWPLGAESGTAQPGACGSSAKTRTREAAD